MWARLISSHDLAGLVTVFILYDYFVFGFIADPIISLYLDPYDTIMSMPTGGRRPIYSEDEEPSWMEHWLKELAARACLGL